MPAGPSEIFKYVDTTSAAVEHASNLSTEASLRAKTPMQASQRLLYEVPNASAVVENAFYVCPKVIRWCVSLALALRGLDMRRMRNCLCELNKKRLQRKQSHASYDPEGYRQFVLDP